MQRYLIQWLSVTLALLLLVALFNAVLDPYFCVHGVGWAGLNAVKPAAASRMEMSKTCQLRRVHPGTLVLGNSRAEVGFDPDHPAFTARPVYNAALPGSGLDTSLRFLRLALATSAQHAAAPPQVVVLGLDFMDFLTDPLAPAVRDAVSEAAQPAQSQPLVAGFLVATADAVARGRELLVSTLTLAATQDSVQTLLGQNDPDAVNLTPAGFNPLLEYRKISREEGYWNVFRQKDLGNMASYMRRPFAIFDASARSSAAWEDLGDILRLCRQHGIALHLLSYPYHAHLLQTIRLTGHWQAYAAWKRTMVQVLAQEALQTGQAAFVFWDFGVFNALTTELVPAPEDYSATMRWYWEAGHFKSALGGLMLDRVLRHGSAPEGFGVPLTHENQQAQWRSLEEQEWNYQLSHPRDMHELTQLSGQLGLHQPGSAGR